MKVHSYRPPPPQTNMSHAGQGPTTTSAGGLRQSSGEGLQTSEGQLRTVGEQIGQQIFTRQRPETLDASERPEIRQLLEVLKTYVRRLAVLAGDRDSDYILNLAADGSAAINEQGIIFLGEGFLWAHRHKIEVLVGAIAHEVGHRPKLMGTLKAKINLDPANLNALLLAEEIKADHFAGRGLAELQLSCEPLIDYLRGANSPPHPAYLPVEERAQVIRDGFAKSTVRAASRQKLFPDFDRHTSARNHVGEY